MESFGRQSHVGREFLDIGSIRQIVAIRDTAAAQRGGTVDSETDKAIERQFRLKDGVLERLGRTGVVGDVHVPRHVR